MESSIRVYIVDDSPIILDVLAETLNKLCPVETFETVDACLQRVGEQKPDLFIVDVGMPGTDGYSLCRTLKADWETQDIPVIFLSANDDIDTRLRCYEAGGDDFIQKPFDPDELLRKLKVSDRVHQEKMALREQAGYAQRTAMSAMASMGELGVVLQFLSKSFACASSDELAKALLDALQQWDLQGAVQLRMGNSVLSLSQNGHDVPLETSVLNHVRNAGRIFQFKSRCVFNYGYVTLLVNNLPLHDAERCGRIRDNGALLAEGADARLRALEAELLAKRRREGIENVLPEVHGTLGAVKDNYRRNCFELTQTMIEFQEALMKSYVHLGLTEGQEEHMTTMANAFMQRMVSTQDESLVIVGQLENVVGKLEDLVRH